ncbi:MAG: sigma-70 family RNA polymerase sigma factor [Candidatus Krumholzibacteria bacterium]|jgi:RNA polymerase sigma factor (sigma-70 family)|nr:sigma-70 family RNA polymerase sigma factor [Candidatus Krumholzibacteria bacterium]
MTYDAPDPDADVFDPLVAAFRAGDEAAGDAICRMLLRDVRLDTARMLGAANAEIDDVVQDSLMVCLRYLRAEQGFAGNPSRLAITIARNRCRDILRHRSRHVHLDIEPFETWLADPSRSPLDDLAAHERAELLQAALSSLSAPCRQLLHALYVEGLTPEDMRHRSGLGTVQSIYYRRGACLAQAKKFLQRRLRFGSRPGAGIAVVRNDRKEAETP